MLAKKFKVERGKGQGSKVIGFFPHRMANGSVGGWAEPGGEQPAVGPSGPAFVEALGSEDLSPSHPEDWAAADVSQGERQSERQYTAVVPQVFLFVSNNLGC